MQTPPEIEGYYGYGVHCVFEGGGRLRVTVNFGQITLNEIQAGYLAEIIRNADRDEWENIREPV